MYRIYIKQCYNLFENTDNNGIVSGNDGLALLCGLYYSYTKDEKYKEYCSTLINNTLSKISNNYSLGYGWAGLIYTTNNLKNSDIFDDIDELIEYGTNLIAVKLKDIIKLNYLDYFSGAGGIINCLIETNSLSNTLINYWILNIKERLKHNSFKAWSLASNKKEDLSKLNLGVPHGLAGYLLLALKLKKITDIGIDDLIIALTEKLLSHQSISPNYHFPAYVKENKRESPSVLAWCHGDLMAAYAILKAGLVLNNSKFKNIGLKILKECTLRNDIFPNNLTLCHGTTSVAYIFYKIYCLTNENEFKHAYLKWKNISNEIIENQFKDYENNKSFFEDSSLFTGVSGFILANLTMDNKISSEWDSCLLF